MFEEAKYSPGKLDAQDIHVRAVMTGVCRSDIAMMNGDFGPLPIHCFYNVFGERIDTERLIAEYEGDIEDYPGDNSER